MSLAIVVVLIVLIFAALVLKSVRFAVIFTSAALIWVFFEGGGMLPSLLLKPLQSQKPAREIDWHKHNVIILLCGGVTKWANIDFINTNIAAQSRVHEAARLYFLCTEKTKDCHVLVTGGDALKNGVAESEVMATELKEIGVNSSDILLETKSNNTFQNAQFTRPILEQQAFDQTVLVTSGYHLKRAMTYFSYFHINAVGAPADYIAAISSPLPIAYNFMMTDLAIHEWLGILRFRVYGWAGLNPKVSLPGSL